MGTAPAVSVGAAAVLNKRSFFMDKEFLVISHTHWDREWYFPFEKFRMRLCDLINHLLDIIDEYPDYIFHLDGQTIVLEDYLEIYPENREKLTKYIQSGNIIIGPWYVQNDFFLASGESTVRNMLIGRKIAESFGKCANVGYTADQFGLPTQLPQIFKKLGVSSHLFGRGYAFYKHKDDEDKAPVRNSFYWEAPDGSRVFSQLMQHWYNNMQRLPEDIDRSAAILNRTSERVAQWSDAPCYLMMNGVDHLEPQENLLPILEKLNARGENIHQTTMQEAMDKLEKYAPEKPMEGELRYGKEIDILTGTFSTRVDIKKLNYDAQNLIEHKTEPLFAMIMLAGAKDIYPKNKIDYMWKTLIPNHAHDSICCCSHNNVMKHMSDRYLRIKEVGDELLEKGCAFINHHIERSGENKGDYYLTVINTSQAAYTGVMDICVDINAAEDKGGFEILSKSGEAVPFEVISRKPGLHATFSPKNLPGNIESVNYKIQLLAENIPPFGYENYIVRPTSAEKKSAEAQLLENEFLKVDFENGRVNLRDKKNGIYYSDVLSFEDVGDAGDSYTFVPFENDTPVKAVLESIENVYANGVKSEVCLEYTLSVPEEKDENGRSGKTVNNKLYVYLSLGKGERALAVRVKILNNSKYHLIRAAVDTGIDDDISYASSIYDVVRRDDRDVNTEIRNHTQPVNGFVYKKAEGRGLAVYTKGLYEYENADKSVMKLSLLRSTDMICFGSDERKWGNSDNLMLGEIETCFALMPFDGDDGAIPAYEQNVAYQPLYWCDSTDVQAFTGGRPAVQGGEFFDLYVIPDKYRDMKLPQSHSFIDVNESVCVSALKKAEKGDSVVLRMYNPGKESVENIIGGYEGNIVKTDLKEEAREEFSNQIEKKEILSVII